MSGNNISFIPLTDLTAPETKKQPHWVTGFVQTTVGKIAKISTDWNRVDTRGEIKARISNQFRMKYKVDPGLYAVGNPNQESPVLLSANYKLSFDILRRASKDLDIWILVLDTKGINVWCAAGKGTFGTEEIIRSIQKVKLNRIVSHRKIISPQLGAPGIEAHKIKKKIGFKIKFGPIQANDIRPYLENRLVATEKMREIDFGFKDRIILTPMEISLTLKKSWKVILAVLIFFGITPEGIIYKPAFFEGFPFILLLFSALLTGAFITPALLPWIPFRAFSIKGFLMGLLPVFCVHYYSIAHTTMFSDYYLLGATYIMVPSLSAYLAFNFTGCTTYTSPSGVTRELKALIKMAIILTIAAIVLLVCYKLKSWGLI